MSALRRDLLERKLWIVVAVLVLALVAVPVLLLKGASAGGAALPPAPPAAGASAVKLADGGSSTQAKATEPAKATLAHIARNPFASGVPHLSSKPSSQTPSTSTATASASATPPSSSTSSTSTVAMVSPSPSSSGSASGGTASAVTPTTPSTSRPATSTPTTNTTPTSTIASASPTGQAVKPAKVETWTTYSVSVRFGKNLSVPVRTNIARLTPMPSAQQPYVMFMGVMSHGAAAVFALRQGVGHTGPAWCHPSHDICSAIVLKAGQTEDLTIPSSDGTLEKRMLRVVKIASSMTHSRAVALAAFTRVSHAGLCDLLLADPMLYHLDTGTYSNVPKDACAHYRKAVPFSYFRTNP